jgi:drug/metabolite transporter (DMT)-like permease
MRNQSWETAVNNPASYVRLGTLALLWGASFLFIKVALTALSATQIALTRIVLGALVLLVLCAVRGMRPIGVRTADARRVWLHTVVAGLFASALPWILFGLGEATVASGLTGVLNATTPLWTLLFGLLFGREQAVTIFRFAGLILGFGGVVLIFAPWQAGGLLGWGVLACLAASASYGVGYVYIGRHLTGSVLREQGISPLTMAAMQMTAAAGIALVALPIGGLHAVRLNLLGVLAVAALGVFGTGVAFALNYRLISDEGPTTTATVTYLIPIVSVLLGWWVLQEQLGVRELVGMGVVLLGVGLSRRISPGKRRSPFSRSLRVTSRGFSDAVSRGQPRRRV